MRAEGDRVRGRARPVRRGGRAPLQRTPHKLLHLPRLPAARSGRLRNWFAEDADKLHTLVLYESPYRTAATLAAALDSLGDREAAVCIELTKAHERVERGWLSDLAAKFASQTPKGEVAIVIAGANPKFARRLGI